MDQKLKVILGDIESLSAACTTRVPIPRNQNPKQQTKIDCTKEYSDVDIHGSPLTSQRTNLQPYFLTNSHEGRGGQQDLD